MPTSTSHITKQTEVIWLETSLSEKFFDDSEMHTLFAEAKEIATRDDKPVMVRLAGRIYKVTADSDLDSMISKSNDHYNCAMIIK